VRKALAVARVQANRLRTHGKYNQIRGGSNIAPAKVTVKKTP